MRFILISAVCVSAAYIIYRLFFRKETNFHQLRAYLLVSIIISVLLPFNTYKINPSFLQNKSAVSEINFWKNHAVNTEATNAKIGLNLETEVQKSFTVDWIRLIRWSYILIVSVLLFRILLQVIFLVYKYLISEKEKCGKYVLIRNHRFKNSFSFFKWIFIDDKEKSEKEVQSIIAHEMVHAKQYHSVDIVIMEIMVAVMWFNPLVWMMRKSIHLVHEYLADEGVLSKGIDKISYQELLINQVAEEKLISISSSFNQSLIKKRIVMMNYEKILKKSKYASLIFIPVALFLFIGISCINGQHTEEEKVVKEKVVKEKVVEEKVAAAISPTKMNVLYVGIDNPIKVAVSGYESTEIDVAITNASIRGKEGEYIVNPKRPGSSIFVVRAKGEVVQQTTFRVKGLPDPMVMVAGKRGGEISKNVLLAQEAVFAMMANFDFDIEFKIEGFTVSTTDEDGYYIEVNSGSNKITKEQKQLIENCPVGARVNFEQVTAKGPDGTIRKLPAIVFKIVE